MAVFVYSFFWPLIVFAWTGGQTTMRDKGESGGPGLIHFKQVETCAPIPWA